MSLTLSSKTNSIIHKTSPGTTNKSTNSALKELQEKCYENLMDVCRGLATSLNISTSAVMTLQVSKKNNNFYIYID